jgi:hypothetical protein
MEHYPTCSLPGRQGDLSQGEEQLFPRMPAILEFLALIAERKVRIIRGLHLNCPEF